MAERTIMWPGESGQKYKYWIHDLNQQFNAVPGNYIFARETKSETFNPIYIGQTSNLNERLESHEKLPCIREHEASHICTHTSSEDEEIRRAEETDLIKRWNPICNK